MGLRGRCRSCCRCFCRCVGFCCVLNWAVGAWVLLYPALNGGTAYVRQAARRGSLPGLGAGADEAEPCRCLEWRRAYESGLVACGDGPELRELEALMQRNFSSAELARFKLSMLIAPGKMIMIHPVYEFCSAGFQKFSHRRCVNTRMGKTASVPGNSTWCYVSGACQDLRGGQELLPAAPFIGGGQGVSWKFCEEPMDASLHSVPPRELLSNATRWAKDSGSRLYYNNVVNLGWLAKWSYPVLQGQIWSDIEPLWESGATHRLPLALREAVEAQKPMVIDVEPDGHGTQIIIYGQEVWDLSLGKDCPNTVFCYRCISGCEATSSSEHPKPSGKGVEL